VDRLADVGAVAEHPVDGFLDDPAPARRADAACANLSCQLRAGPSLEEAGEDPADTRGDVFGDHQLAALDAVAVGRDAAHPDALPSAGGGLVADALGGDVPLEPGEGPQDVQRQLPHGGCRVERLRDRDERHGIPVEHLHQLGEVGERAAETVDLLDHHHIDQPVLDVLQQPLHAGPFQRAAGDAAVVILIADQ
jgi:hypothetical protein